MKRIIGGRLVSLSLRYLRRSGSTVEDLIFRAEPSIRDGSEAEIWWKKAFGIVRVFSYISQSSAFA